MMSDDETLDTKLQVSSTGTADVGWAFFNSFPLLFVGGLR